MKRISRAWLVALFPIMLMACAPAPSNLSVSATAQPFARITLPTDRFKVYVGLRDALENTKAIFVITGVLGNDEGFRVFWSPVVGQSTTTYFLISGNADTSVIRVLTEPNPPSPQTLARELDRLGKSIRDALSLSEYKLEPDR